MAKLEGREMTDEVLLDLVERFGLRVQKIIKTIGNNKLEVCDDTAERRHAPPIFN